MMFCDRGLCVASVTVENSNETWLKEFARQSGWSVGKLHLCPQHRLPRRKKDGS